MRKIYRYYADTCRSGPHTYTYVPLPFTGRWLLFIAGTYVTTVEKVPHELLTTYGTRIIF